ncbi:amino acid adenylation enzyme/thioester reductase family protein [Saccharomonospora marina XMU15]|uniref:Amino acid adenylation enzyme/thioester reductase family protein n=1 Tax=Saccharomonospora marina XMU15 TaxID=882083 RepID=H5X7T8_9PSEU|nr:non-ribosomal peptide synthetase [Saccharomonospora marina]EHR52438.1 amino acid adenylation enzyme/thioester reductase family protein [Saccharomonospora marina XMU15]
MPGTGTTTGGLGEAGPLGLGEVLPFAGEPAVHERVFHVAEHYPDDVAVVSGGVVTDYRGLVHRARLVARDLAGAGVTPGGRVGVLVEPSTEMVAAVLGILCSGAAYVPADSAHPGSRIRELFADAGVRVVVRGEGHDDRCRGYDTVPVAARPADDEPEPPAAAGVPVRPDSPAYVIYTSGSTGAPKGVLVEHRQLAASTLARRHVYPGRAVFLLVSPLCFDSSVAGIWGTLTSGGCLVVATAEQARDPQQLVGLIEEHGVTQILCVPGLYRSILDAGGRVGLQRLRTLTTVVVAGETLPESLVRKHFEALPATELVNEYGPTETTVWASYHRFRAAGRVTIGKPVPGARLYVLDALLDPVPPGTDGELFVGGVGVARGYLGRPGDTARAFVHDPFAGIPGARMYRTGDIARWTSDGRLEFRGRRDRQTKVRGHRVELGAVEAELAGIPGVEDAAVLVDSEHTALEAAVVAAPGTTPEYVRARLADRLPPAMVPARIVLRADFPRTVNGKIDHAALRAELRAGRPPVPAPGATHPAPGLPGDLTAEVAAAWAEVLMLSEVPDDTNFFDAGGHSYAVFTLQDALERRAGVRPPVVALFRHTTVAAQAELIRDLATSDGHEQAFTERRLAAARHVLAARAERLNRRQAGAE